MTLIESVTPLPNFLGKFTTILQILYIAFIYLKEIAGVEFTLLPLDIFILFITVLSLVVYAFGWFKDIKNYHQNE
jgi:cardiolipin synthase